MSGLTESLGHPQIIFHRSAHWSLHFQSTFLLLGTQGKKIIVSISDTVCIRICKRTVAVL